VIENRPVFGFAEVKAAMIERLPEVPRQAIKAVMARHLARREAYVNAVRRHGSPLYVIDQEALRDNAIRFCDAFGRAMSPPIRVYYAFKSNNHPTLARTLLECGLGLDVSSGAELQLALSLGADSIIFSGPGKTDRELSAAVDHAENVTILLDSFSELSRLEAVAARRNVAVQVGVRLTTIRHGLWRKFGVPLDQLGRFMAAADTCGHVNLRGLQFHTSWNTEPSAQTCAIRALGDTLRRLPPSCVSGLRFVDIGGGYWPEQGEWLQAAATPAGAIRKLVSPHAALRRKRYWKQSTPIERFAEDLARAIDAHLTELADFTVCLEPGRWLCNDAMHLLMTVVDRKAHDLAITDAGTNAVGWERFETDFVPILNLTRPALTECPCDIHGCLCTPHDLWGYSYWGKDIAAGDVLVVPDQGAYTYSLRQDFIKPIPAAVELELVPT